MYLPYYGLRKPPFSISPDPDFLWLSPKHARAFSALKYGIIEEKGFLALIGEVGTGKTLLIKNLINEIGIPAIIVTIPDPDMETLDFFGFLAEEVQMKKEFSAKGEFLLHFRQFLLDAYGSDKKVLLIIDEAQRLNIELLEQIRLLSNIEMTNKKLLNIFFVGQNEFAVMLKSERCKATRQRIAVRYRLEPLDEKETAQYIAHRLKVAGATREIFDSGAIGEIYNLSNGIPRIINIICDNALMVGYGYDLDTIDKDVISTYKKELHIPEDHEPEKKDVETEKKEIEPIIVEKPKPIQSSQKKPSPRPATPPRREETYRKASSYIRNSIIFVFFLLFGFTGYYIYDSNTKKPARWTAQDIAPKKDFGLSKIVPQTIAPKIENQIKNQPITQLPPVAPIQSLTVANQDKTADKNAPRQSLSEGSGMAEPGEEKESENAAQESDDTRDKQKTESSQLAESEERTISDNLIAKAAADDADIEELKNKQEHEIEPKKSDATGENQITEPNTSTDNEPGVTHEEIVAQALTAETLFADSAKKKQSELNSADAEEAEESRSVEPSSLAKEAGNNILEKVRTDKNFEKNSTNAPLLQDLSIIDGKILVYFSHDSLELSEQSIETLKIISEILSKYPSTNIIVEGYTDSKGNFWYNEKLSQARANVVKSYFKLQGISQARITAQGMGSQNPIGDNETLEGRRKNRRVEIKIEMEPISNRAG